METSKTNTIKLPVDNKALVAELVNKRTLLATLFGAGGAMAVVSIKDMLTGGDTEALSAGTEAVDLDDDDLLLDDSDLVDAVDMASEPYDYAGDDASVEVVVEVDVPIVEVSETTSFGEAFAAARDELGAGGIFMYRDQYYNTYYKEEWDAMQSEEQDEYFAELDNGVDYDNVTYVDTNDQVVKISIDDDPEPEIIIVDQDSDGLVDQVLIDEDTVDASVDVISSDSDDGLAMQSSADDAAAPSFDMEEGDFGDLETIPEPEVIEVDPADIQPDAMEGDTEFFADSTEVDLEDLGDPDDVVEVAEEDLNDDVTPDEFLDELFNDDLPEADESDLDADDLPDPINDADLDDWGL